MAELKPKTAPKAAEPTVSFAQKANHVTEDAPQWLERRLALHEGEAVDMRTTKVINTHTNYTMKITYDAKGNEISRKELKSGLISTTETFLDAEGRVIKTNLIDTDDNWLYEEIKTEYNGATTIKYGKRYKSDGSVNEYYTRTREGSNVTYIDYDAKGNVKSKYETTNENGTEIITEITYKDDVPAKENIRKTFRNGTQERITKDYVKGTKVIEERDKDHNVTTLSETGLDDVPEFLTKEQILKQNAEVYEKFPQIRDGVTKGNLDVSCAKEIAEVLQNKKPTEHTNHLMKFGLSCTTNTLIKEKGCSHLRTTLFSP